MKLLIEIDDDGKKTSLTRWLMRTEIGGTGSRNMQYIVSSFKFMIKELEAVLEKGASNENKE